MLRISLVALGLAVSPLAAVALPSVGDVVGTNPDAAKAAIEKAGCKVSQFAPDGGDRFMATMSWYFVRPSGSTTTADGFMLQSILEASERPDHAAHRESSLSVLQRASGCRQHCSRACRPAIAESGRPGGRLLTGH